MAKDPVCGMMVDKSKPTATSEYRGEIFFFCSPGCKAAFDGNPEMFVGSSSAQTGQHGHS